MAPIRRRTVRQNRQGPERTGKEGEQLTWEIFLGLAALVTFLVPILTVTVRLVRTLTHLEEALCALKSECDARAKAEEAARKGLAARIAKLEYQRLYK